MSRFLLTLRWSGLMVLRSEAQPCPVSPRPWRKIIEAVCFIRGLRITGFSDIRDIFCPPGSIFANNYARKKNDKKMTKIDKIHFFHSNFLLQTPIYFCCIFIPFHDKILTLPWVCRLSSHFYSTSERKRLIPRFEITKNLSLALSFLGSNPQLLTHLLMITICSALYFMCL